MDEAKSSGFPKRFGDLLVRALATLLVIAAVYWLIGSRSAPLGARNAPSPERIRQASTDPNDINDAFYAFGHDGVWQFADAPLTVTTAQFADLNHAKDQLHSAPQIQPLGVKNDSQAIIDELISVDFEVKEFPTYRIRTFQHLDYAVALLTDTSDNFCEIRLLCPSQNGSAQNGSGEVGWMVMTAKSSLKQSLADFPALPPTCKQLASRRDADGYATAMMISTTTPHHVLNSFWTQSGWKIKSDPNHLSRWIAQKDSDTFAITRGDGVSNPNEVTTVLICRQSIPENDRS